MNLKKIKDNALFTSMCVAHGLPLPEFEVMFAKSIGRKWCFDYLFAGWLAVEREGGVFLPGGSRHSRGAGFRADLEKYNNAVLLGYTILRFLPEQFTSGEAFPIIKAALENRTVSPP